MAMEGQNQISQKSLDSAETAPKKPLVKDAEQVTENIKENIQDMEVRAKELQRLSDMIPNNQLKFSVNKDLDRVVITVLDSNTKEVIRQIPSEEIQNFEIRLKEQIGVIFDEII